MGRFEGGEKRSTLDLFQQTWVLVASDERWEPAVRTAAEELSIELKFVLLVVNVQSSDGEAFRMALGLQKEGASLIRPDGYIAWRSIDLPVHPVQALTNALGQAALAVRRSPALVILGCTTLSLSSCL